MEKGKDLAEAIDTAWRICRKYESLQEIPNFEITEQSLEKLRSEGVPDDVLKKLEDIKNQGVIGEGNFVDTLKTAIGDGNTIEFKSRILKHAPGDRKNLAKWLNEIGG